MGYAAVLLHSENCLESGKNSRIVTPPPPPTARGRVGDLIDEDGLIPAGERVALGLFVTDDDER